MNLTKTIIQSIFLPAALLGCMALSSCVAEDLAQGSDKENNLPELSSKKLYATFRLDLSDEATRAWVPDTATYAERAICPSGDEEGSPHKAIFFNADREFVAMVDLNPDPQASDSTADWHAHRYLYVAEDASDALYDYTEGKIYTVLNASEEVRRDLKTITTLNGLYEYVLNSVNTPGKMTYVKNDTTYFTMSSSMVIKGESTDINNLTPATDREFRFYPDEDEAKRNPYTLYVERLCAKFTVVFKNEERSYVRLKYPEISGNSDIDNEGNGWEFMRSTRATPDGTANNPFEVEHLVYTPTIQTVPSGINVPTLKYVTSYDRSSSITQKNPVTIQEARPGSWKVNILGWGINALEKNQYMFKKIIPGAAYTNKPWFRDTIRWPYRTFWAQDPHYYGGDAQYARQYRHVDSVPAYKNYENVTMRNNSPVEYFNFNTLSKRDLLQYTPEHTFHPYDMGDDAFRERAYLRVGTHLITTAQLLIEGFEPEGVYGSEQYDNNGMVIYYSSSVASKYLMNGIYWSDKAYREYVAEYLGYWMLTDKNKEIIGDNDGNFYVFSQGNYILARENNFTTKKVYIKGGDARVMITPTAPLFKYNGTDYNPIDNDFFEKLAWEHTELMADVFTNGRMYYAAGCKHNLDSEFSDPVLEGDYGTVRNNWYSFRIDYISAPGTPVAEINQEIVPNNLPNEDAIGATLKVEDWHSIYESVDINDQKPKPNS